MGRTRPTTKTGLVHGDPFAATRPGERVKVYARLAEQAAAHRITLPDGEPAWLVTLHAGEERQKVGVSVQQQSTATTELFSTFAFIQMRPDQRKQGSRRLPRRVRDEEVAGSNPVTPTTV
jgi:hypothetical protein